MRTEHSESPDLPHVEDRALPAIIADLWTHTERLMRQELDLVRADLDRKMTRAKTDVMAASMSGAVLYAGVLALVAAAIALLAIKLSLWAAAGIVGLVLVLVGYFGMRRGAEDLAEMEKLPRQAGRSLERTARSIEEATR